MKINILINDKNIISMKYEAIEEEHCMEKGKHWAIDVAWYLVYYVNSSGRKITNLKLQKILYYIQAQSLKQNKKPLFSNPIEAWRHGPVVREVYSYYREYMNLPITDAFHPTVDDFTEEEKKLMHIVVEKKLHIDDWELVAKTHEEAPWKNVYGEDGSGMNKEITPESILKFFKNREI